MNSRDFFESLGDIFYDTFTILESAGNKANIFFILAIAAAAFIWILQMIKHQKQTK